MAVELRDIHTRSLELLDRAEEFVLDTFSDATDAVSEYVPEVDMRMPEGMPKASEMVDEVYEFAGEVIASQREFVGKLLDIAKELVPKKVEKKAPRKTTTKKVEKKPATRVPVSA